MRFQRLQVDLSGKWPATLSGETMKTPVVAAALLAVGLVTVNTRAAADEHDNHSYVHHDEWHKGRQNAR